MFLRQSKEGFDEFGNLDKKKKSRLTKMWEMDRKGIFVQKRSNIIFQFPLDENGTDLETKNQEIIKRPVQPNQNFINSLLIHLNIAHSLIIH